MWHGVPIRPLDVMFLVYLSLARNRSVEEYHHVGCDTIGRQ